LVKAQDEAGHFSFLIRSCSQVGFAQTRVTTGEGGLLHHLFTLTLRLRSGRSFFCGTFRPFRVNPFPSTLRSSLDTESSFDIEAQDEMRDEVQD
jgi:hypothetical protein